EALSRGASTGVAIDANTNAVNNLRRNLAVLQCDDAEVLRVDSLQYLSNKTEQGFDIVLLDAQFHQDLLLSACQLLEDKNWLNKGAWIYTEREQSPTSLGQPITWPFHRENHTGQVHYALWQTVS